MGRIFPMGAALLGVILAAAPVAAADLKVPPIYVKAPPVQLWRGGYVGVNVGYGWGDWDSTGTWGGYAVAPSPQVKGWFGGVQGGHNWLFDRFVFGLEADIQLAGISGSTDVLSLPGQPSICAPVSAKCSGSAPICAPAIAGMTASGEWDMNWFSTLRARAGWTIDRSLLYVTAGAAIADIELTTSASSSSKVKGGFAVGAGVETSIARNWTAKAEYLYLDFGDETFQGSNVSINSRVQEHVVRIGANYHF